MSTKPVSLTGEQFDHCKKMRVEYMRKIDNKYKGSPNVHRYIQLQHKLQEWQQVARKRLVQVNEPLLSTSHLEFHTLD